MNDVATSLTVPELVAVRPQGPLTYLGTPTPTARGAVFGGQLAGQTMSAAAATVSDRYPWPTSLQLFFISAPDPSAPIEYEVTPRRDGGSFSWRNVVARQDGRVVLEALAAFQSAPTASAPSSVAEAIGSPDELHSPQESEALHGDIVGDYYRRLGTDRLDTRFVQGAPPLRLSRGESESRQQLWVRPLDMAPMSPQEIGCCLAYISDVTMLATPMLGMGRLGDGERDYASSFDHSVRFYSAMETIDWIAFDQWSVTVADLTLEAHGRMATADGRLVATITQQGVLRLLPDGS